MPKLSKEEFEQFYVKYYGLIISKVVKRVKSYPSLFTFGEVKDLTDDIFIELYEALKLFRGESSQTHYVVCVAENCLNNEYRKRMRRSRLLKEYSQGEVRTGVDEETAEGEIGEDETTEYISPVPRKGPPRDEEAKYIERQRKSIVNELIGELDKQDEKLASVIKFYILGLTDNEIGEELGVPGKTVFNWRNKAFEILKKILKERGIQSLNDIL